MVFWVKSTNLKGKKGERYNEKAEVKSITKKGKKGGKRGKNIVKNRVNYSEKGVTKHK